MIDSVCACACVLGCEVPANRPKLLAHRRPCIPVEGGPGWKVVPEVRVGQHQDERVHRAVEQMVGGPEAPLRVCEQ